MRDMHQPLNKIYLRDDFSIVHKARCTVAPVITRVLHLSLKTKFRTPSFQNPFCT